MILLTRTIENVEFDVEIALNSKICILHHNGNPVFFEDIDLAQVVRAVKNSATIEDLIENTNGIWREEQLHPVLKSYALERIPTDDFIRVLTESDEWTQRKLDSISRLLRHLDGESEKWLKFRAMMFDTVKGSGVLE